MKLENKKFQLILAATAIISLWTMLVMQLSTVWQLNEQYSHGHLVPFLCIFLLLKSNPTSIQTAEKPSFLQGKAWLILGVPFVLLLPFIWIIRGANSDWRLLNFVLFFVVFIFSLIPFYDHGGWKRIKFLLFPLLFFLVAIPWPLAYDLRLTQFFQERVSSIIVDILLILEHEASLQGTVIDVGVFGQIGIDQACSGINGLQASIVVSLFLGAYYKFRPFNRISLLFGGIMIAIGFNLLRAFSMSYIKVKGKGYLLDNPLLTIWGWNFPSLHDLAGWIETFLILVFIFLLARSSKIGFSPHSLGDEINNWPNLKVYPNSFFSLSIILSVFLSITLTSYHYKNAEKEMVQLPRIELDLVDDNLYSEEQAISKQIATQLHYEDAKSIQWQDRFRTRNNPYTLSTSINPNYEYWQLFEASWDFGGACTAILSTHSPDSCLPLTGFTQVNPKPGQEPDLISIKLDDYNILFETYEFLKNQRKFFVFRCFWPNLTIPGEPNYFPGEGYSLRGRLKASWDGRRNVGGTMLALALANTDSNQNAIKQLDALLKKRLKLISSPSG